mmetsp:Transcript_4730/g.8932  ORF Transcript_4730/g.8932 Transcript_4730/m.8932 type:complete len:87 (-) Transcript_4730:31-291(-)
MVSIPENVVAGEQFPVTIRGLQLTVTCPMQAAPGMSVRIVPPLLEDEDEDEDSSADPVHVVNASAIDSEYRKGIMVGNRATMCDNR